MSLRDFYATQIRVLWEWRGGPVALLRRLILTLVVATLSFIATAWLMPGLTVDRAIDAALAVIFIALFNAAGLVFAGRSFSAGKGRISPCCLRLEPL